MFRIKDARGITLIEFLTVLGVAFFLVVAAVPTFITIVQNYRLSAVAENLYYQLQYARSEAIKRNAAIYVRFTTGDNWCYGISTGSACDCTAANNCNLSAVSTGSTQQISLSTNFTNNTVNFESSHAAANASGSVTLTLYGQSSLITLNVGRLGNIQMCSTGISGYTAC